MASPNERQNTSDLTSPTDLSRSTIRRQLAIEAIQYPVSTLALCAFALSGIYLLVLSPVLGGGGAAVLTLGVSGTLGGLTFAFRYRKGFSETVRTLLETEAAERIHFRDASNSRMVTSLRTGFDDLGHTVGSRTVEYLANEYDRLQPSLNDTNGFDFVSRPQIEALTAETYSRGLSVLGDALALVEAIHTPGIDEIDREIAALETEIEAIAKEGADDQQERLAIKKNLLDSHRSRRNELRQAQVHIDELLFQSHRCELSLNHTRIELVGIKAGSRGSAVSSVTGALERTINRAREVQEELKNLGY